MPLSLPVAMVTFKGGRAGQVTSIRSRGGALVFENPVQRVTDALRQARIRTVMPHQNLPVALGRRALLGGIAACGTSSTSFAEPASFGSEWLAFKSRFLSRDGRIIDNANGGVSHSEGQGWGLLFAEAAQDQAGFDLILKWTSGTLRRPNDALHVWRYVPHAIPSVQDPNNAVDGDMFIAAALIKAGRSWGRPDYMQAAANIGRDILRLLVRVAGSFTVLLPGIQGFETTDAIIINPSYYAFPMITELASIVPSPKWGRLQEDGRLLLENGRFGPWSLPPDWLRIGRIDSALSPAPGWPPRFSYDAVRVPLWWCWQKLPVGPAMQSIGRFWSASSPNAPPAWVDLKSNEVASYAASPGMIAIMRLMRLAAGGAEEIPSPLVENVGNYYDAALVLLARIAEQNLKGR
jgi:endoglucanase